MERMNSEMHAKHAGIAIRASWLGATIWKQTLSLLMPAVMLLTACAAPTLTPTPAPQVISAQTLEEEYGLRVFLIAVTAAGGLIDLRVKIVDGEKAATLLQEPSDYPVLQIEDGTILLPGTDPPVDAAIKTDANLFIMFSNPGGTVKPGDLITVVFGSVALEPITVQ